MIGVTLQLYDHGEAVGRTRTCCAGQDICDARAVAEKLGIAHYVIDEESCFREVGDRALRRRIYEGPHADPLHRLQPGGEVHRPAQPGARARRRLPRHRPLCAPHGRRAWAGAPPRRRSGARPELLPVRHHPRPARLSAFPAGRPAQAPGARDRARTRPRGRRQARQPGHLLRSRRRLRTSGREGPSWRGRAGDDRRSATCSAAMAASSISPSASAAASRSAARPSRFMC